MKKSALVILGVFLVNFLGVTEAWAQFRGGSYYTRKIVPPPAQPARSPARTPAPVAPVVVVPGRAATNAVAAAESAKAKAEREAILKRSIAAQRKRAEAGDAGEQYGLGVRYLTGDGLEKDLVQARKWLELSKKNGYKWADKKLEELKALESLESMIGPGKKP